MDPIDLDTAIGEIQQACEDIETPSRKPFFFIVGAGISHPTIPLASVIQAQCMEIAKKRGRTAEPAESSPLDTYSHWVERAFPQPKQRQTFLRRLIESKSISQANFRLAHLLLDKVVTNVVVTPNFDDFISRALTLFGKSHIVCDHPQTVERINPEQDDIQIVHVHGSYWFYDCCNLRKGAAWGQIFTFDYDYSQSPPTGDRQEQTPSTRISLLVCQSLLRREALRRVLR